MWLLLALLSVVFGCEGCDLPPRFWCDTLEIAKSCNVVEQCAKYEWSSNNRALVGEPVHVTVYIESLCPDCKRFIKEQLFPTWAKLQDITHLEVVPYGNAMEKKVGNMWEFNCQHGKEECVGNIIESCAINLTKNVTQWFPFIHCIEIADDLPREAAVRCAAMYQIDYTAVDNCARGSMGNQLEHQMATKTDALNPPHKYVPWVTINGVHTEPMEKEAESNLLKLLCDTYKGPKPKACLDDLQLSHCQR